MGEKSKIEYTMFEDETEMPSLMTLIAKDLSEPYSIFTYRYFINNWQRLCWLAYDRSVDEEGVDKKRGKMVGVIVCRLENHRGMSRGYIAMLAVDKEYRGKGIGTRLVSSAIESMIAVGCDEVALETEGTNTSALSLYSKLGFIRDKRLHKYYLNGNDAYRLMLPLTERFLYRSDYPLH
eukprot:TRINITY_DN6864_c0_g1_i4.p1 TRINITY_DN6864_c0_g1~~TRINITY_DN6864_c0_g1_i4.p1  ORF type:complete len:179 (-),score=9.71 TRINITY_DN6864_c0_g1_i4:169-705(-)